MLARLVVHLQSNYAHLTSGLRTAQSQVRGFASSVKAGVSQLATVPGLLAGSAVAGGLGWMVKASSDAEQLRIQFEVLTGSAREGASVFKQLEQFALKTSFSLESAGESARNLMASGVGSRDLIGTMSVLGNLAMGDAERLKLLSKAYTDVMNKGKLQAQELRQFAENGVGLVGQLAAMYGKSGQEILAMSEAGQITFPMMQQALIAMTSEGGRFNNMMGRMAETTQGRWDTLKESIAIFARTVTGQLLPHINDGLAYANSIVSQAGDWWLWLQNQIAKGITVAMAVAGFAMDNWQDIAMLAVNTVMLGFVTLGAEIMHFWGVKVPAVLTWFADNWKDIFFTLFDLATTVFINLGINIRNAMTAIWDYIASGGTKKLEFAWTPLTEGFVNSIKELPDIPERVIGPLEAEMQRRVEELGASVGGGLGQAISDNLAALEQVQAGLPQNTPPDASASLGAGSDGMQSGESAGTDKKVGALMKGSAEAQSAIYAAMREKEASIKVAQKALSVAQAQLAETKRLNAKLESGGQLVMVGDLDS